MRNTGRLYLMYVAIATAVVVILASLSIFSFMRGQFVSPMKKITKEAALFMMVTKELIKNRLKDGDNPEETLFHVNNQLAEGNNLDMFVTVWLAVL